MAEIELLYLVGEWLETWQNIPTQELILSASSILRDTRAQPRNARQEYCIQVYIKTKNITIFMDLFGYWNISRKWYSFV